MLLTKHRKTLVLTSVTWPYDIRMHQIAQYGLGLALSGSVVSISYYGASWVITVFGICHQSPMSDVCSLSPGGGVGGGKGSFPPCFVLAG